MAVGFWRASVTHVENPLRLHPRGSSIALAERDQLFCEPLGFLGFGPCGGDGLVLEEGGDEVAEEGLTMGGAAIEVTIFEVAASHGGLSRNVRL